MICSAVNSPVMMICVLFAFCLCILMFAVAYVTYSAVSDNPDLKCNYLQTSGSSGLGRYGIGPTVVGLVFSAISILWISSMTARKITTVMTSGSITKPGVMAVVLGQTASGDGHSTSGKMDLKKSYKRIMATTKIAKLIAETKRISSSQTLLIRRPHSVFAIALSAAPLIVNSFA